MVGDHDSHQPCRCAQHGPILGAVTFSDGVLGTRADAEAEADRLFRLFGRTCGRSLKEASPEMIEHVRRAVDDYVASLDEVEDDAATVVELVKRGDSWHISIRSGAMYCENAEPSWEAAVACVGRILGQPWQSVDSCSKVPTVPAWKLRIAERDLIRAELLAALPPCRIDDPEALAKLTPSRVRAYLKNQDRIHWLPTCIDRVTYRLSADALSALASVEGRSAAAVYLDILAAEPGEGQEEDVERQRGHRP